MKDIIKQRSKKAFQVIDVCIKSGVLTANKCLILQSRSLFDENDNNYDNQEQYWSSEEWKFYYQLTNLY